MSVTTTKIHRHQMLHYDSTGNNIMQSPAWRPRDVQCTGMKWYYFCSMGTPEEVPSKTYKPIKHWLFPEDVKTNFICSTLFLWLNIPTKCVSICIHSSGLQKEVKYKFIVYYTVLADNDSIALQKQAISVYDVFNNQLSRQGCRLTSSEFLRTVSTLESGCSHGDILATTSVPQSNTSNKQSFLSFC